MVATVFQILASVLALTYLVRFAGRETLGAWSASHIKTGSVAALVLAGLAMGAPAAMLLGLALAAAGDFSLSRRGDGAFMAGMAAFGLGHLAYLGAFLAAGSGHAPFWTVAPLIVLAASTEVWLAPHTGALLWPVRAYVFVIVIMALAALTLGPGHVLLLIGVGLFMASDLMLALERFVLRPVTPGLGRAVWASYWLGQALILAGSPSLATPN